MPTSERRQQRGDDDFDVPAECHVKDVLAGRVLLQDREVVELAGKQQRDDGQQHGQMREHGDDRAKAKPLDGVDRGEPHDEREQPEAPTERSPAGRRRGFGEARRVDAGKPRETEQQQRRGDGNRRVRALALRQEDSHDQNRRRQEQQGAPGAGNLRKGNRGAGHQPIGGHGQEREAPGSGERADRKDEKNAVHRARA